MLYLADNDQPPDSRLPWQPTGPSCTSVTASSVPQNAHLAWTLANAAGTSQGPLCPAAIHHVVRAVGVFPFRTHMTEKAMKMGYVAVETLPGCSLFPRGVSVRGHIYHFSEILEVGPLYCPWLSLTALSWGCCLLARWTGRNGI